MNPAIIVDTNIVVAGLLTSKTDSPVALILDGMLEAAFPFVVSTVLLNEYRTVLERPALCKAHGLNAEAIERLLVAVSEPAIVLAPVKSPQTAPDPGDQHLWDLLATREDLRLVTGDRILFQNSAYSSRILAARAFLDIWHESSQEQRP